MGHHWFHYSLKVLMITSIFFLNETLTESMEKCILASLIFKNVIDKIISNFSPKCLYYKLYCGMVLGHQQAECTIKNLEMKYFYLKFCLASMISGDICHFSKCLMRYERNILEELIEVFFLKISGLLILWWMHTCGNISQKIFSLYTVESLCNSSKIFKLYTP